MGENRIGVLQLQGQDAVRFAKSFYTPTMQEMMEHKALVDRINHSVSVSNTHSGFEADIEGLDLSFLDDESKPEKISATVTITVGSVDNEIFCCNGDNLVASAQIDVAVVEQFSTCHVGDTLSIAA